nr:HPr kinase/phosphatase C-terminal domain-containing protein [Ruegeria arenilitoris]
MWALRLPEKPSNDTVCVHATCVAVAGRGALISGPSGVGKSALALQMMGFGADLVADDRVNLTLSGDRVLADAVPQIRGLIEARGVGLLRATACGPVPLDWIVDLDQVESQRLPEPRQVLVLGHPVPLLHAAGVPNLASALVQLMKMGRVDPLWPST